MKPSLAGCLFIVATASWVAIVDTPMRTMAGLFDTAAECEEARNVIYEKIVEQDLDFLMSERCVQIPLVIPKVSP